MKKAADLLKVFLDKSQLKAAEEYSRFFRSWEKIAGERLAAHSKVQEIEGDTVLVVVDHPGWFQEIHMNRRSILKKLQNNYPEMNLKKIRFQLAYDSPASPQPKGEETSEDRDRKMEPLDPEINRKGTENTDINDPLQCALEKLKNSLLEKGENSDE